MTAQGKLFAHQQRSTHRGEFPTQSCLRQSTKAHVTLIALSPARMVVSVKHNTTALQATYARALRERWCHSNILYVFGAPTVLRRRKLARSVLFVFLLADSDSDALPQSRELTTTSTAAHRDVKNSSGLGSQIISSTRLRPCICTKPWATCPQMKCGAPDAWDGRSIGDVIIIQTMVLSQENR